MSDWKYQAVDLLKKLEALRTKAYKDVVGVYTIGFGTTGTWVKEGVTITAEKACELLLNEVNRIGEVVDHVVKVPLTEEQKACLVSFTYNVGDLAFSNSTLVRYLNDKNYDAVPAQLRRWVKDRNGNTLQGLVNRREREIQVWESKTQTPPSMIQMLFQWLMSLLKR